MTLTQIIAKISTMVSRGVVSLVADDAPTQMLQVETFDGEVSDDVEHFQPQGLSFRPPDGSEAAILAAGGGQEHLIAVCAFDRDTRPTDGVEGGEGGLYSLDGLYRVFLDKNGRVFLSQKAATQSFVRGQDLRDALVEYANDVTEAVGLIAYSGAGTVNATPAAQALAQASLNLLIAVNDSLSTEIKGE